MSIADAVEAEDSAQLFALLLPKPRVVKEPSSAAVGLCNTVLALAAAQDAGLRPTVASAVARATLHPRGPKKSAHSLMPPAELTRVLDSQLAELIEMWNVSAPEEFMVAEPENLPDAILSAQNAVILDNANYVSSTAAAGVASARARAIRLKSATTAIDALELDTEERSSSRNTADAAIACAVSRGNAIIAKLRLLRATVAAELYDTPAVSALREASRTLNTLLSELEPQANEAEATMARYRRVEDDNPNEFIKVVREYRSLMRELEEKKWSLKELGVKQDL